MHPVLPMPLTAKRQMHGGLHDMSGNVSEWCLDIAPSAYTSDSVIDPTGPTTGLKRIYRGGSWFDQGNDIRSARRFEASKNIRGSNIGFRIIRIHQPTE